ncbi:hypothetical protein BDB01DRAFT_898689 [Pilobolus umbonatus]|nr:hypothetical protein BDB01DRAFT_898689 [Pilobolus umbonatus]
MYHNNHIRDINEVRKTLTAVLEKQYEPSPDHILPPLPGPEDDLPIFNIERHYIIKDEMESQPEGMKTRFDRKRSSTSQYPPAEKKQKVSSPKEEDTISSRVRIKTPDAIKRLRRMRNSAKTTSSHQISTHDSPYQMSTSDSSDHANYTLTDNKRALLPKKTEFNDESRPSSTTTNPLQKSSIPPMYKNNPLRKRMLSTAIENPLIKRVRSTATGNPLRTSGPSQSPTTTSDDQPLKTKIIHSPIDWENRQARIVPKYKENPLRKKLILTSTDNPLGKSTSPVRDNPLRRKSSQSSSFKEGPPSSHLFDDINSELYVGEEEPLWSGELSSLLDTPRTPFRTPTRSNRYVSPIRPVFTPPRQIRLALRGPSPQEDDMNPARRLYRLMHSNEFSPIRKLYNPEVFSSPLDPEYAL